MITALLGSGILDHTLFHYHNQPTTTQNTNDRNEISRSLILQSINPFLTIHALSSARLLLSLCSITDRESNTQYRNSTQALYLGLVAALVSSSPSNRSFERFDSIPSSTKHLFPHTDVFISPLFVLQFFALVLLYGFRMGCMDGGVRSL